MIGSCLAQRYEIVGELGRGGMGVVYRAKDLHLGREVAVKVLPLAGIGGVAEERFMREALLAAKMDHPSIVPIYDLGRHEDVLFFVMPVVDGETLHAARRRGSLSLGETLEIAAQVAEALDYSHQLAVVHRDIKPENVMVSRNEEPADGSPDDPSEGLSDDPSDGLRLRARVMDFGLALVTETENRLTQTGSLPGTLGYLSPEQILGSTADGRSDLYSLGTILYECLAGKPPFSGARYALLYQIVNDPPPPLNLRGVDPELGRVVELCLAKDPAERPSRGLELAGLLRRHAADLSRTRRRESLTRASPKPHGRERRSPPPLFGREKEVAELERRLDLAASEACQLVLIGGEMGMGKTRLLAEVEKLALERSFRVLQGRFSDHEDTFPFQAFGEVLQDYFRGKELSTASSDLPDLRDLGDDLATLFPALTELDVLRQAAQSGSGSPSAARSPALQAAKQGDPTHLFEVLARALARLAEGRPTAFLLENLHRAEISIEALQYLVRRLGPTAILFVATYRPSEIGRDHALPRLVRGFRDEPCFSHLELAPLDGSAIHRLVRAQVGGEVSRQLSERLFETTEGNPFFVRELTSSLLEAGEVGRDTSGAWALSGGASISPDNLPETIQQAVETRLERLPEDLLEILQIASVLGRTFDWEDLEALIGESAEEAVERLLAEGLLEEERQARGDILSFSNGVVRDVLHQGLSRRRRRRLHRRHAELLEERFAGRLEQVYPQLVHHFAAGDVATRTIEYALALARRSLDAMGSRIAIRALETALEFVEDEEVEAATEGELRHLLGSAHRAAGQNEAAMKEAAKGARILEACGDLTAAAKTALLAAEAAWQGRRVGETRRFVEKGIEIARAAESREVLGRLLALAATVANLRGEHHRARSFWEEAENLRVEPDAPPLPRGGVLQTSLPTHLRSIDPRERSGLEAREVLGNVFDTLIVTDAEGQPRPALAESWEASPDQRTFRLRLRGGIRFSDGTPLDAERVARCFAERRRRRPRPPALQALCDPESGRPDGLVVEDERTLVFHLLDPLPIFPFLLSDFEMAVYHVGEAGKPVGTGPFVIAPPAGEEEAVFRLERNPGDWRPQTAFLDAVELRIEENSARLAEKLLAGEIDIGRDFRLGELDEILRDPRFRAGLVEATRRGVCLAVLNRNGPRSRELELRRALFDVVRIEDIVWRHLGRFAQPATSLVPPGLLGHDPGRRRPRMSPSEATARLAELGEAPIRLRALVQPLLFERYPDLTAALFAGWSSLGIEVEAEEMELAPFLRATGEPEGYDLWLGRWIGDFDDPDAIFQMVRQLAEGDSLGAWIGSVELDERVDRAGREIRAAARQRLYRDLESLLIEERTILPLFYDIDHRIGGPWIRGLELRSRPPYLDYARLAKIRPEAEGAEGLPATVPAPRERGVLHLPETAVFESLAPRQAHLLGNAEVVGTIFETLTRLDEGARVVPCLASEFRLEDGGRGFRFKLRSNLRFHDGRKLTVRDVRWSFEELIRTFDSSTFEAGLVPIRGAKAFRAGEATELEGFEIVSTNELAIKLERPLSFFPAMLTSSSASIVPEGCRIFTGSWRDGCVGTGPFRVVRFVPGERLELEANPHYWRKDLPRSERLEFELGGKPGEIAAELGRGRLALGAHLLPKEVERLKRESRFAAGYLESPGFSTYFLVCGTSRGPLAAEGRREILRRVLDVGGLVRSSLGRLAAPAHGLIPPGLLGYEGRRPLTPEVSAVDDAIFDERPLEGVELRAAVFPAYVEELGPFWELLVQVLERAGARLRTVAASPQETLWRVARGEVDLAGVRWVASYPDPDALIHFFHTHGQLGPLVGSKELDKLFERGRDETDPALRHALYREIDSHLASHEALLPFFHEQIYRFAHPDVEGLELRFGWPEVAYEELRFAS